MALTITTDRPQVTGNYKRVTGTITFDSSYATGGESFSLTSLGMYALTTFTCHVAKSSATNQYLVAWNESNTAPTLKVFQGDNPNAAAAPFIEVPNTTNLAALTIRFEAIGY